MKRGSTTVEGGANSVSAQAGGSYGPREAWINLKQTVSAMEQCAEGSLTPHGLTAAQFDILIALSDREVRSGCELPRLAERLDIEEQALMRAAAKLRDRGVVALKAAGARSLLKLTPQGIELRTKLRTRYESMLKEGLLIVATQAAAGYFWSTAKGSAARMRTAAKRGLLAWTLVLAAPVAALAQARGPLEMLMSPSDSAAYSFEAVPGASGGPAVTNQSLQGTLLLSKDRERRWSAGARAGRFETDRPIALPNGRGEVPHLLWNLESGLGYHRKLGERRAWGGRVSIGSASDRPFDSIQETEFRGTVFYTTPSKESNAWLFFLNYSNNSTFLSGVPFPGFAYSWRRPKEGWQVTAGFPFISASYRPDSDWALRASLFGIVGVDVEAERRAWRRLKVYAAFQRRPRQWLRADRLESRDRLVYDSKEALLGLRFPAGETVDVDMSAGRSFDRRFFEARDASRSPSEKISFAPAWTFTGALTARFGGTGEDVKTR